MKENRAYFYEKSEYESAHVSICLYDVKTLDIIIGALRDNLQFEVGRKNFDIKKIEDSAGLLAMIECAYESLTSEKEDNEEVEK